MKVNNQLSPCERACSLMVMRVSIAHEVLGILGFNDFVLLEIGDIPIDSKAPVACVHSQGECSCIVSVCVVLCDLRKSIESLLSNKYKAYTR